MIQSAGLRQETSAKRKGQAMRGLDLPSRRRVYPAPMGITG